MPRDEEFVADVYSESKKSDAQIERSRKILSKFNKEQRNAVLRASALGGAVAAVSARVITELGNVERATKRFFDNFTMAPLLDGLQEYQEQLASLRTMATNASQFEDDEDAIDRVASATSRVNEEMKKLNEYADLTVYKFSDMTYAAKRFITAGFKVEDATAATKGIGNLVAFLGGDSQAYSTSVEMFSQAMAQGKLMAYQYNSLSRQGMTGEAFQRLAIMTAKKLGMDAPEWDELTHMYNADGTLNENYDDGESFKETLADDWLNARVLQEMFKLMSQGEALTTEALTNLGYSEEDAEFISNMAVQGQKAATKVKTYSEFIGATQEAIGTGWAAVFQNLLGGYDEATELWSGLLEEVTGEGGIGKVMDYLESEFSKLGIDDRENMSAILFNVWTMIKNIVKSISNLLGVSELKDGALVTKVQKLLENLKGITDILAGNALVDATRPIGKIANFLGMIWGHLKNILGAIGKLTGNALRFVWELLGTMFDSLHGPVNTLLTWLEGLIDKIANSEMLKKVGAALKEMVQGLLELSGSKLSSGLSNFFAAFGGAKVTGFGGFVDALVGFFQSLGGMFNGEGNVGSFLGASGKLLLGLIMLSTAFKIIARIGKSFNGAENNFWTIIGTIFAIVVGVKVLNNVSVEEAKQAFIKTMILAVPIWLFTKAIMKIAKAGKKAAGSMGGLIALFVVIGAFVFGVYELANRGKNLDKFEQVGGIITRMAVGIGYIALGLAALFAAISLFVFVLTRTGSRDVEEYSSKKLAATLNIDSLSMRLAAIAAVMSSMALLIETLKDVPTMSWGDLAKIGALVLGITIIMGAFMVLAKFTSKTMGAGYWMESTNSDAGSTKKITKNGAGKGSPAGFMLSTAILLISLIGAIALIKKVADKLTVGDGTIAKMWIVYGLMAAILVLVGLVGLLSTVPGYNSLALLPMALVIGSLALVMYELIGVAALLKNITTDELDKLKKVVRMFALVVLVVGIASAIGNRAGGAGVALSMAMIATIFIAIVAIFRAVTEEDVSKIKAVTEALKTAFIWITVLVAIFAILAIVAGATGVGGDVLLLIGEAFLAFGLAIASVGAGALLFVKAMEKMVKVIKDFNGTSFKEFMKGVTNFQIAGNALGNAIGGAFFQAVAGFLDQAANESYRIANDLVQILIAIMTAVVENTATIVDLIIEFGKELGRGLAEGFKDGVAEGFKKNNEAKEEFYGGVTNGRDPDNWKDYIPRFLTGFAAAGGIANFGPAVLAGLTGAKMQQRTDLNVRIPKYMKADSRVRNNRNIGISGANASPAIETPVDLNGNPASGSASAASENDFLDKLVDGIVGAISGWFVNIDGEAAGRMANNYLGEYVGALE